MEDQLADSFFGFDATLSGSPDVLNDETEDGQDEEFYDALNEETFGTDAVEGDWEQDHEKLAEITEQARVRSNSYNGIEERYNDNGAEMDCVGGGDSDLADSISRFVLEDQEDMLSTDSKGIRNYPLQMDTFDGSYSSSAPSGFSLWSNGGLTKGQASIITVPAASGTIWDPAVLQSSPSATRKESGNALSNIMYGTPYPEIPKSGGIRKPDIFGGQGHVSFVHLSKDDVSAGFVSISNSLNY